MPDDAIPAYYASVIVDKMSDTEVQVPIKRFRKVKKELVIKNKKVHGEAHINHRGKAIEAKTVGPDCK